MEITFSGYCRTIDAARIVLLEMDGAEPDIECDYGCCAFRDQCSIGKEITALLGENGGKKE